MSNQLTLEKAALYWSQATAALKKYPEARLYLDNRKKWAEQMHRRLKRETEATAAKVKERKMWAELEAMKDALPSEAREVLS